MVNEVEELGGTGPASRILGCSAQWVRALVEAGRLHPVARTVDGTLLFDLAVVRALAREREADRRARAEAVVPQ